MIIINTYVCISLYSLPFTGFESLPKSVQTNLSKSPRNPQVICPGTWTRSSVEVLRKFLLVPVQGSNPKSPASIIINRIY